MTSAPRRTIAITGAASGLGAATRGLLEGQGARVVGVDLRGSDVAADLGTPHGRATAVRAVGERAGGRLDGLVVCAGLGPTHPETAAIVSVNYFGARGVLDGLAGALARGERAAAVAISSNSVTLDPSVDGPLVAACLAGDEPEARRIAAGLPGNTVYASSKAAVGRAVRHGVALWGERGVRLNAVAPGPFDSPMLAAALADPFTGPFIDKVPIPLGRRGTTHDIAEVVVWLLSGAARHVHGSILFADGGTDALFFPDRVP